MKWYWSKTSCYLNWWIKCHPPFPGCMPATASTAPPSPWVPWIWKEGSSVEEAVEESNALARHSQSVHWDTLECCSTLTGVLWDVLSCLFTWMPPSLILQSLVRFGYHHLGFHEIQDFPRSKKRPWGIMTQVSLGNTALAHRSLFFHTSSSVPFSSSF